MKDPNRSRLDEVAWATFVQECKTLAGKIRSSLADALLGYYTLGRRLVAANLHGQQLKALSKELGEGFSPTTLYRCFDFAIQYPTFETFMQKYGASPWRDVCNKILVKRSRTDFNALKNEPAGITVNLELPIQKRLRFTPAALILYEHAKTNGYKDDFGSFASECVEAYFGKVGLSVGVKHLPEGKVEYLDSMG